MAIEFSFVATPELGPKAMRYLLWRRGGPVGPLALVLLPFLLAVAASDPAWRPAAYAAGGAAIMLLLIFLLAVAHRRRMRARFFRAAADRTVKVSMKDEGLAVTSELGSSLLPWTAFERMWAGRSVILLFYHGWHYVAFPAEAVPKEAIDFAQAKIRAGKMNPQVKGP
jgi:hypothetical protein